LSETHRPRRVGRSVGVVLAGILVGAGLSLGTDILLHLGGIFPALGQPMSDKLLLLATLYRTIYNIVGAYTAARLAPYRPMMHALALGAVGLVLCIVGAAMTWNKGPAFGPHWYPVTLVVLALPCAWLGGRVLGPDRRTS
jgi:hypothetical protein